MRFLSFKKHIGIRWKVQNPCESLDEVSGQDTSFFCIIKRQAHVEGNLVFLLIIAYEAMD